MLSGAAPGAPRATTDRAHAPAAAAVPLAWDLEEAVEVAVVAAEGGGGKRPGARKGSYRSMDMNSASAKAGPLRLFWIAGTLAFLSVPGHLAAQQTAAKTAPASITVWAKTFDTPQQAADALVAAAEQFDERSLNEIFGPGGED